MKRTVHGKVNGRPHMVPLAASTVAILRDLPPLSGHGRFVFPSLLTGERSMSENTMRTALRRMGYTNDEMTPHDFPAMARTVLVEQLNINPDVIEAQLAHGRGESRWRHGLTTWTICAKAELRLEAPFAPVKHRRGTARSSTVLAGSDRTR